MKTYQTDPPRWQQFVSGLAMFAVASLTALSLSGCGGSDDDYVPPPPPPLVAPAAPTAFTATAGADAVTLQWTPSAVSATAGQPASYEIYRSETEPTTAAALVGPANFVATIPSVTGQATPYSYIDTGLPIATTYYYVVTAKNAAGETPSTVASDRVPGLAPAAPTAFTVTGGENVATLQWTPPAISDTAGLPDSYEIYRSTTATTATALVDPANLVTTIADTGQTTAYSYTDIGLPGTNTKYYYVVTAKNTAGETLSTVASDRVPGLAPAAPTAFTVTGGENVATLQWTPPAISATAGQPESYEIYRSTIESPATALVDPANFVTTIADTGQTTPYSYTDIGLPGATTYYYVVAAKNSDGKTPSTVESDQVTGPPRPATYGNNFSAALIFADDIGITNLPITGTWTLDPTQIDYNTGLRPLSTEAIAVLPSLTVPSKIDPLYYEQKSINTWQGEWAKGKAAPQDVTAKWGDNLSSASLSASAKIRIEMVLTKDVTATPMTAYTMKLLSGSGTSELQGTNGVTYNPTTAFVMATNARLQIQKLDDAGVPTGAMFVDQALFDPAFPDGLNKLSGEIPVSGNFTYGFVWDPATTGSIAGKYRVTFKLDPTSLFGVGNPANNTFMKTAINGVRVSDTEAYIDINVK